MQSLPKIDELEVSIFGPGFGESIVIHTGNNKWFIIDSSINPLTKSIIPLEYLTNLGVTLSTQVAQVIITHWHNDHMQGVSKIIERCSSAQFVCAGGLRNIEFLSILEAYNIHPVQTKTNIDEVKKVFDFLKRENRKVLKFAVSDKLLWKDSFNILDKTYNINLTSLTPSDESIKKSLLQFAKILPIEKTPKRSIPYLTPNYLSVVLLFIIGDHCILLGADLEEEGSLNTGWSGIINSSTRPTKKAKIFKVPHHGSKNGEHPNIWTDLLEKDPYLILTPFINGNNTLPTKNDIARILNHSSFSWITGDPKSIKTIKRDNTVEKEIREVTRVFRSRYTQIGHIRMRTNIDGKSNWNVELFDGAHHL